MEALSFGNISHVIRSTGKQVGYTAVILLGCIKWNSDGVSVQAYMIHGEYYKTNVDTDEILLLLA